MRTELNRIYLERERRKKRLLSLKNRYFAIIYKGRLDGDPLRKIHKALYDATVSEKPQYADKYLLAMAIKASNRAQKVVAKSQGLLAIALWDLFHKAHMDEKAKKIINYDAQRIAEKEKSALIGDFVDENRKEGKWFYLASSHNDCAEDHKPYQGRLYVDEKAPKEAMDYAKSRGLYTVQWVMGAPAWFITRPNCRHYFVAMPLDAARGKSLRKLRKKYKTHTPEGDRAFQTPRRAAVEEYTDRLRMLRGLYREYPTDILKKEILKAEMLVRKWKKAV